ncbi:hypothetical protein BX666DRAFT_2053352 [Dichotomocladium elegans]|nr:hypothetical protein BX666DRAFT_2053352 [Dichotomocladium elegans]
MNGLLVRLDSMIANRSSEIRELKDINACQTDQLREVNDTLSQRLAGEDMSNGRAARGIFSGIHTTAEVPMPKQRFKLELIPRLCRDVAMKYGLDPSRFDDAACIESLKGVAEQVIERMVSRGSMPISRLARWRDLPVAEVQAGKRELVRRAADYIPFAACTRDLSARYALQYIWSTRLYYFLKKDIRLGRIPGFTLRDTRSESKDGRASPNYVQSRDEGSFYQAKKHTDWFLKSSFVPY